MRIANLLFFNAVDASTTQTSSAISIDQVGLLYANVTFTGSPVGTIKIQRSGDPGSEIAGVSHTPRSASWQDYPSSSQTVNGSGVVDWNVSDVGFPWIRFVYTSTSGTGTATGYLNTKGF